MVVLNSLEMEYAVVTEFVVERTQRENANVNQTSMEMHCAHLALTLTSLEFTAMTLVLRDTKHLNV